MKKILLFLFLSLSLNVFAQEGWQKTRHVEGDELKGTGKADIYPYFIEKDDIQVYVYRALDEPVIFFSIYNKGIFNYKYVNGKKEVEALIGFYQDGKLIDKLETTFMCDDDCRNAYSTSLLGVILIAKLETHDVRFVIPRYQDIDLDFTIPKKVLLQ